MEEKKTCGICRDKVSVDTKIHSCGSIYYIYGKGFIDKDRELKCACGGEFSPGEVLPTKEIGVLQEELKCLGCGNKIITERHINI